MASDRPQAEHDSVRHLMEAARPIAALAARLGEDADLAKELVHAAHENDTRKMEEIFRAAGVPDAKATINEEPRGEAAEAATRTRSYGISVDIGPVHFSIHVDIKK